MVKYIFGILIITIFSFASITASALPTQFDPGLIMTNQDVYSLPLAYSSAERIQAYFESTGSILATTTTTIGFEDNGGDDIVNTDDLILDDVFATVPEKFRPRTNIQEPYGGQEMLVSELIWKLSRERFGNSCLINYYVSPYVASNDICIDTEQDPINPALLIAVIQKESGLVYGSCSKSDAQNAPGCQSVEFRLDRIMGYACFENPDRSKTCYDENPNWKFHKGIFRQLFKAVRLLRIREESCKLGGSFAFQSNGNVYQVGNTINISNQNINLKNGITCAMYIYTPHVSAQELTYNIMKEIRLDFAYLERIGLDPSYAPKTIRIIE